MDGFLCSTKVSDRATEVIHASIVVSAKSRFRPFCWDFSTCRFPKWKMCDSCYKTSLHRQNTSFSDIDNCERYSTGITSLRKSECYIGGMDFVTLIFTLLAVPLHRMSAAVAECFSVLKHGG
ncbi:putative methyltransferase [Helianthus anomalus]